MPGVLTTVVSVSDQGVSPGVLGDLLLRHRVVVAGVHGVVGGVVRVHQGGGLVPVVWYHHRDNRLEIRSISLISLEGEKQSDAAELQIPMPELMVTQYRMVMTMAAPMLLAFSAGHITGWCSCNATGAGLESHNNGDNETMEMMAGAI